MLLIGSLLPLMFIGITVKTSAEASTPTFFGSCVFGASDTSGPPANLPPLQATFTPGVTATSALQQTSVTIAGTGTCAGNTLVNTVHISLSDYGTLSCEGGEGPLFGLVYWTPSPPGQEQVYIAYFVAGPGTLQIVMLGSPGLEAVANLVWSTPGALASCPIAGTTNTDLSGTMEFASS
jgi:hypothetical protein